MSFTVFLMIASLVGGLRATSDPQSFKDLAPQDPGFENFIDIPLGRPDEENLIPGEPLSPNDFKNALLVSNDFPPRDQLSGDPLELAGLFEGDISGVHAQQNPIASPLTKNAIRDKTLKWPKGEIPYVIQASFSQYDRSVIARAMLEYHNHTCIRFVPRTNQRDYIYIQTGAGCSSNVGRTGGSQSVTLGNGCVYVGIVIHELMHASGFWHEQSRADRDEHITIVEDNIVDGMAYNFLKYSLNQIQYLGAPYDTGSVMHYDAYAFAKDRRYPTIVAKQKGAELGQRRGFSKVDILKINRLYECDNNGGNTGSSVATTPIPLVSTELPGQCTDSNKYCSAWANQGECRRNAVWMNVNCRKSCNQCDVSCANQNVYCEKWAKTGECTRNKEYMNIYCPKACGVCSTGASSSNACEDGNNYCAAWANRGQCKENPDYMLVYCKKSCKKC